MRRSISHNVFLPNEPEKPKTKKMNRSFVQTVSYQLPALNVMDADNIFFYPEKHDPQQKEIDDLYIFRIFSINSGRVICLSLFLKNSADSVCVPSSNAI
jgi:hypothetical protein